MTRQAANIRLVHDRDSLVKELELEYQVSAPQTSIPDKESGLGLPPEFYVQCKDGERTDHLTRLAGKLIKQGHPLDVVTAVARDWNTRNFAVLPEDKVNSTCKSIWATDLKNHPDKASGMEMDVGELQPLFDIDTARASRFAGKQLPQRKWLLHKFLPQGKVGSLVATGGTGKSNLLLQLAASVAGGTAFLGRFEVPEPGAVLILAAEDDEEEIHRRLENIVSRLSAAHPEDTKLSERIRNNIYVRSMVAENNLITCTNPKSREVEQTSYVQRLILTAQSIPNLRLTILDPASRFRGGDENAAQDATRFIEALERVREETGAAVLVAHHTNKWSSNNGEQTQHAARGSAAFSDGVRWQLNMQTLSQKEATNLKILSNLRRNYVVAEIVKNNYGPPAEPILLRREDGGFLVAVEPRTTLLEEEDALLSQVRQILSSEAAAGQRHSKNSFEKKFGGEKGPLKTGQIRLRSLLKEWVDSRKLTIDATKKLMTDGPMPSGIQPSSGKSRAKTKG